MRVGVEMGVKVRVQVRARVRARVRVGVRVRVRARVRASVRAGVASNLFLAFVRASSCHRVGFTTAWTVMNFFQKGNLNAVPLESGHDVTPDQGRLDERKRARERAIRCR